MEFEWDDANMEHIAEHNVTIDEAEFALKGFTIDTEYQDWHPDEERFAEVGLTAKSRCLVVITTWRDTLIRVVTAFDAPKDLAAEYHSKRWK